MTDGSGPINGGPVDTIDDQCAPAFSIGGTVTGLRLPSLVLDINGESTLLFDRHT